MRSEQEIQDALMTLSKRGKEVGYPCRLRDVIGERAKALAWVLRWCNQDGQEIVETIEIGREAAAYYELIESLG